jgi:hypothetical protein
MTGSEGFLGVDSLLLQGPKGFTYVAYYATHSTKYVISRPLSSWVLDHLHRSDDWF